MMVLQILAILGILSFLVLIHELGHFLAAKLMKVKIEEFGLGYPPRAATLFRWRGTIFSLNWIPFGGFVKLEGEDTPVPLDVPASLKTEAPFYAKSALARLFVILAGAGVNFLFGIIAFSIVFSWWGIPLSEARISRVMPDSPAAQAQLPESVRIVELQFAEQTFQVDTAQDVITAINQHPGKSVNIITTGPCERLNCDETTHQYTTTIRTQAETPAGQGLLGIVFESVVFYPWYEMPFRGMWFGILQTLVLAVATLQALGNMITQLFLNQTVPTEVTGPVGIVYQTYKLDILKEGVLAVLNYAGLISVSLAIMNILPIPALDGGRAAFILLEKIIGRHRSARIESYAHYAGYVVLLSLIVLITFRDIFTIIKG